MLKRKHTREYSATAFDWHQFKLIPSPLTIYPSEWVRIGYACKAREITTAFVAYHVAYGNCDVCGATCNANQCLNVAQCNKMNFLLSKSEFIASEVVNLLALLMARCTTECERQCNSFTTTFRALDLWLFCSFVSNIKTKLFTFSGGEAAFTN